MIIFLILGGLFLTPIILAFLLLVFIYKNDDLEEQTEEQQSLINASRRNLKDAEERISQRNILLEYQEEKIKKLKNKLTIIEAYITSNNYGDAEIRLNKLKELVRDYQSQN